MKGNSTFLRENHKALKELIGLLTERYTWASVLGTDCSGLNYEVTGSSYKVSESMWSERGFVARIYYRNRYFEYSFSSFKPGGVRGIVEKINHFIDSVSSVSLAKEVLTFDPPAEEKIFLQEGFPLEEDPLETDPGKIFTIMKELKDKILAGSKLIVSGKVRYEGVRIAKVYISPEKDLSQAYVWSQCYLFVYLRDGQRTRRAFRGYSGARGPSLLMDLESKIEPLIQEGLSLLETEKIRPGEYEVILSPEISGLIAHEAFGHGVETDMIVRGRSKAGEYMGKRVGSPLVSMRDGAANCREVSSFFFDDEGTLAGDTLVLDKGILVSGLSDKLSASLLGIKPTGNGKRESFERRAYARMTNTFFCPGESTFEEMLKTVSHGYLIDKMISGMEDPKNWGIQCETLFAWEIRDGRLTGKLASPVMLTGYIPEVLGNITMVSRDLELSGCGSCGKGYKEYVKVSSGGPYIKTKMRLG